MRTIIAGLGLLVLTGCQSNFIYEPIVPNPPNLEMANARCQMMSSSAEQGMIAWGNPNYVAGAQLGNAIGNAIRVDQFMQQCMTIQGWRRVAATSTGVKGKTQPKYAATGKPYKLQGGFPPAP